MIDEQNTKKKEKKDENTFKYDINCLQFGTLVNGLT